jgi:hypothetical protein
MHSLKPAIIFILVASFAISFGQNEVKDQIIGKWEGEDNNDLGNFNFTIGGFVTMENRGEVIGGEEFVMNGKTAQMRYEINAQTSPHSIDIIVKFLETLEEKRLLGIFEFIDASHIRIAFEFGQPNVRPGNYNEGITLSKKE